MDKSSTLKSHLHQYTMCLLSQKLNENHETPSPEVLCTKRALSVNIAGLEIG